MQELINKITQATGMSDEEARKSIEIVSSYLKDKTPKPFHAQIDNMINGGKLSEGIKEQLMDTAVHVKEKTEDILKEAADKMEELAKNMREKWGKKQ